MGSVGSSAHASDASQPQSAKSMVTNLANLLGSSSASDGIKCSQSASSASSASMLEHRDIDSRLVALEKNGIEFSKVEIYKSPLQLTGVGNHHGLIYHYEHTLLTLVGGQSDQTMQVGEFALRVDWGQDGLSFCDLQTKHTETVVKAKQCGLSPATLLEQIKSVRDEEYNLLRWNCQHFSRHLFEQAGGNWHLSSQLSDLQSSDANIIAVTMYEHEGQASCLNEATEPGSIVQNSTPVPGLIYWHDSSVQDDASGIQIEWVPGGLGFRKICDSGTVGSGPEKPLESKARNCGLKPAVVSLPVDLPTVVSLGSKTPTTQGIVNAAYVKATPGTVKKACECKHKPIDILEHLREVEGKSYQAEEWNSEQFVWYMWQRILVCGSLPQLDVHLIELKSRGVIFTGLQEIMPDASVGKRSLAYSYVPLYSSCHVSPLETSRKPARVVYLKLMFDERGLRFEETLDGSSFIVVREKVEVKRARKANIKVRLAASDLQQQLHDLQERSYNSGMDRDSGAQLSAECCDYLFEKMPGSERRFSCV